MREENLRGLSVALLVENSVHQQLQVLV